VKPKRKLSFKDVDRPEINAECVAIGAGDNRKPKSGSVSRPMFHAIQNAAGERNRDNLVILDDRFLFAPGCALGTSLR
jgi:hypothetical protein